MEPLTKYGKRLGQFTMKCPYCGGEMIVSETEYNVPNIGRILIVNRRCQKCGYRKNEIIPLNSRGHRRIYFRVERPEDYKVKVIRSPYARIIIPELGLSMDPGIDAEMFITNVEGIIYIFKNAAKRMFVLENDKRSKQAYMLLERIFEEQSESFTLIIDDKEGISSVETGDKGKILIEIVR